MNRIYIHYGHKHFDKNVFDPITKSNIVTNKPVGGLWGSPVDSDWTWKDWCEGERFHLEKLNSSFKFTLANGSKVFHIRTNDDVLKLPIERYPEDDLWITGWTYDWIKISKKYDAVELHISDNYSVFHECFYSWDVDSIVVLNPDVVREVEG